MQLDCGLSIDDSDSSKDIKCNEVSPVCNQNFSSNAENKGSVSENHSSKNASYNTTFRVRRSSTSKQKSLVITKERNGGDEAQTPANYIQLQHQDAGIALDTESLSSNKLHESSDQRIKEKDDKNSAKEIKVCKSAGQRKYRKRQKLKDRSDVVNKSLLRAIKKYFVNIFKEEFPQSRFRSALKCARQFYDSLHSLMEMLDSNLEPSQLTQILGVFINCQLYKQCCKIFNIQTDENLMHFLDEYSKCCNSYSHMSFERLKKNPLFVSLIKLFESEINERGLDKIKAIKYNKKRYHNAIQDLICECITIKLL